MVLPIEAASVFYRGVYGTPLIALVLWILRGYLSLPWGTAETLCCQQAWGEGWAEQQTDKASIRDTMKKAEDRKYYNLIQMSAKII